MIKVNKKYYFKVEQLQIFKCVVGRTETKQKTKMKTKIVVALSLATVAKVYKKRINRWMGRRMKSIHTIHTSINQINKRKRTTYIIALK